VTVPVLSNSSVTVPNCVERCAPCSTTAQPPLLDFGGLAFGDPTVDLIVAWEVLDAGAREVFRRAVGSDDETWLLGRAWALSIAVMTFPYYWDSMPKRCHSRLAMARSVLADAAVTTSSQQPPVRTGELSAAT
jgi:hypothetical protein